MMREAVRGLLLLALLASAAWAQAEPLGPARLARIKDIAHVKGVRDNQLFGQGLVLGLQGTGDGNSVLTSTRWSNFLAQWHGAEIKPGELKAKNVAVVEVVADLPPYAHAGDKLDVTVMSVGEAESLVGGVLLQTALKGADGHVYAVAQGPVLGSGAEGPKTVVRLAGGANVERELPPAEASDQASFTLVLTQADFTTAVQVAGAINNDRQRLLGIGFGQTPADKLPAGPLAWARDPRTIVVNLPESFRPLARRIEFISRVEQIPVDVVDSEATVVINLRTKTVIIGSEVTVSPAAITHGTLSLSGPPPSAAPQPGDRVVPLPLTLTRLQDLVGALNRLQAGPEDIIQIIEALHKAGKLHGRLVVM